MDQRPTISLGSPAARHLLTLDLPGLPPELAHEADVLTLCIISACWLDLDDRLARAREGTHRELHARRRVAC